MYAVTPLLLGNSVNVQSVAEVDGCVFGPGCLLQVYSADEAFATGTFAGLLPVVEVDGRVIGSGQRAP